MDLDPRDLLRESMKRVPAVKYAMGVAGVATAAAIAGGFFRNPGIAALSTAVMLGMMFVLVVFVRILGPRKSIPTGPSTLLIWCSSLVLAGTITLLFTSLFFDWPKTVGALVPGVDSGTGSRRQSRSDPGTAQATVGEPETPVIPPETTGESGKIVALSDIVTNRQYKTFVDSMGRLPPMHFPVEALELDAPVVNVNWHYARQYCEWLDGHLPTRAEWHAYADSTLPRFREWTDTRVGDVDAYTCLVQSSGRKLCSSHETLSKEGDRLTFRCVH